MFRYNSQDFINRCPELKQCIDQIAGGYFSPEDPNLFHDISNTLMHHDRLYFIKVIYLKNMVMLASFYTSKP